MSVMRGKGTQVPAAVTVSPSWVPFFRGSPLAGDYILC
jgi:hypothetical protein